MTTKLYDDLINFLFNNLHDAFKNYQTHRPDDIDGMIFHFFPRFLECLKQLVCHDFCTCILCILIFTHFAIQPLAFSEADHIYWTLQAHFDKMLCDILKKLVSFISRIHSTSRKPLSVREHKKTSYPCCWDSGFIISYLAAGGGAHSWWQDCLEPTK